MGQRLQIFLHPRHHKPRQLSSATADKTKQSFAKRSVHYTAAAANGRGYTHAYYDYYFCTREIIIMIIQSSDKRDSYVYTRLHAHTSRQTWQYPRLGSLLYTLRPPHTTIYMYTHTLAEYEYAHSHTHTHTLLTRPYTYIIIIILLCV